MILQINFGLTYGSLSIRLKSSRLMIAKVLLAYKNVIVHLSTAGKTTLFASMIQQKYSPFDKELLGSNGWSETRSATN